MTPRELAKRENALFDRLEREHRECRGRLYRDGIPSPEVYLEQPVRVVFVFREPNLAGRPRPHDMRDEVRDEQFRPLMPDGNRRKGEPNGWWNRKAGLFAHAVAAAIDGESWRQAFNSFREGGWNHDVVNRFGYVQIKKVGGGGTSKAAERVGILEQVAYKGSGVDRRFKVGVPMHRIQEALAGAGGEFERVIAAFE